MGKIYATQDEALELLLTNTSNIFVTGKAGTGKSTLLEKFRESTNKNIAILAPTGVAAINVKGQTIHSFFSFPVDVHPSRVVKKKLKKDIFEKLDIIVIDEISMVRADLLDCIDTFLRLHGKYPDRPFGGVQAIFFGDLFQLPPVLRNEESLSFFEEYRSPYFFDANCMKEFPLTIVELDRIYRQNDPGFISILNAIREGRADMDMINKLNTRLVKRDAEHESYVYVTTVNAKADNINSQFLKNLKGESKVYEGDVFGEFSERDFPTPYELVLKKGAQVMLLVNDFMGRFANGTIATVTQMADEFIEVEVDGKKRKVEPFTWEKYAYVLNEETSTVERIVVGSYTQFPIKLSWAMTIHKSQGKTFDKIVVDFGSGAFAHGQAYVALSRARSLDGIILTRKVSPRDIIVEERVLDFMLS